MTTHCSPHVLLTELACHKTVGTVALRDGSVVEVKYADIPQDDLVFDLACRAWLFKIKRGKLSRDHLTRLAEETYEQAPGRR